MRRGRAGGGAGQGAGLGPGPAAQRRFVPCRRPRCAPLPAPPQCGGGRELPPAGGRLPGPGRAPLRGRGQRAAPRPEGRLKVGPAPRGRTAPPVPTAAAGGGGSGGAAPGPGRAARAPGGALRGPSGPGGSAGGRAGGKGPRGAPRVERARGTGSAGWRPGWAPVGGRGQEAMGAAVRPRTQPLLLGSPRPSRSGPVESPPACGGSLLRAGGRGEPGLRFRC